MRIATGTPCGIDQARLHAHANADGEECRDTDVCPMRNKALLDNLWPEDLTAGTHRCQASQQTSRERRALVACHAAAGLRGVLGGVCGRSPEERAYFARRDA